MSYRRYLKENRGQFLDHRYEPPKHTGIPLDDLDGDPFEAPPPRRRRLAVRGGGAADAPTSARRNRYVTPVFAKSAWSDPLPYEEPWERAWR